MNDVTALIVLLPEADPVVGPFRAPHDSGAARGVPAHITILYPFMPTDVLDPKVVDELRSAFSSIAAFEISLTSIEWFNHDVVYIRPEPDAVLRQMIALVVERWPQWPPYGGEHPDPTPHLTIGDSADLSAMRQAAEQVRRRLPLHVEVCKVQLYAGRAERGTPTGTWHHRLTFPLRNRQN